MANHRITPTEHFPDYLKMDLGLGGPEVHPLAKALDDTFEGWSQLSHQVAIGIDPALFAGDQQSATLAHLGFEIESLTAQEVEAFYSQVHELLRERGTLAAIERLASIYFGRCIVHRGYPWKKERSAGSASPAQVTDDSAQDKVVFVRLGISADEKRKTEFTKNANGLVPEPFRVTVADPQTDVAKTAAGLKLVGSLRMERRRI